MHGILCYHRSPRNILIMGSGLMRGHVSVICERSLNFWVIVGKSLRLIASILLSPWSQTKRQWIRHLLCFVSGLSSSTKPAKSDNVQNFGYRGYSNRDIIGTASSFLSGIHMLLNQSIPYQHLVFIVISFSVLARQWICLWSYHHFYISIDMFEMNQGEYSSTFEFGRPCHLLLWLDSYMMQLSRYEEKTEQKWWTSSPRRRVILSEWYQCDNFSRVNEGPNSQSTL